MNNPIIVIKNDFSVMGKDHNTGFLTLGSRHYLSSCSLLTFLLMSVLNVNEQKVGQTEPVES